MKSNINYEFNNYITLKELPSFYDIAQKFGYSVILMYLCRNKTTTTKRK
jgi:hypothetical protein